MRWYTIAADLGIRERGPIALSQALEVVDDCFSKLKSHYASGEQAVAATTFGFARGDADFIEICIHSPGEIAFTVELPAAGGWLKRLRGTYHRELKPGSRDELRGLVTSYFTTAPEEFRSRVG